MSRWTIGGDLLRADTRARRAVDRPTTAVAATWNTHCRPRRISVSTSGPPTIIHDEVLAVRLLEVVDDPRQRRMAQLGEHPGLALELPAAPLSSENRHCLSATVVPSRRSFAPVHRTHAALAQLADDAIAVLKNDVRSEHFLFVIDNGGGMDTGQPARKRRSMSPATLSRPNPAGMVARSR